MLSQHPSQEQTSGELNNGGGLSKVHEYAMTKEDVVMSIFHAEHTHTREELRDTEDSSMAELSLQLQP